MARLLRTPVGRDAEAESTEGEVRHLGAWQGDIYLPPPGEGWDDGAVERRMRESLRRQNSKARTIDRRHRSLVASFAFEKGLWTWKEIGLRTGTSASRAMEKARIGRGMRNGGGYYSSRRASSAEIARAQLEIDGWTT